MADEKAKTIGVHTTDLFNHVGFKTGASLFSELGIVQVPTKSVGPSKPTLSAVTAPADSAGVLKVALVLPTTNTDGSVLVRTELIKIALHYKDSPGVDTSDPAIEFPPVEELLWAPGDTDTHYVKIRVMDSHGQWSALSDDEKSAAASAVSVPQEDSGLWAHRTKDSPSAGRVAWANVILYWKDNKYEIDDGDTDKKYIWWDHSLSTTTFQTSDDAPSLELEDVIVVYNDNGTPFMMVYSPMVMADYIRAGSLASPNWGASEGTQFDLENETLRMGGSSSPSFEWIGGATKTLNLTGSVTITGGSGIGELDDAGDLAVLDVVGNAHITDLAFDKITAATNTASLTIGGAGYIQSSNYSAGSAGFRINGNGDAEFNDVTVRGRLITGAGSSINGMYLGSGTVAYGKIAANAVRTNELYIDGDVNFAADGYAHNLIGVTGMYKSTSGTNLPGVYFMGDSAWMAPASGGGAFLGSNNGYNAVGVYDDKVYMLINQDAVEFIDAATTGGQWGLGYINVKVKGVLRSIAIESAH